MAPASITVAPTALVITSSALPPAQIGSAYSANLRATGGTPGYIWSISVGTLPAGLSLNQTTGIISGVPAASGTFSVTAQVNDGSSPSLTKTALTSLTVSGTRLAITSTSLTPAASGANYSAALKASGGTPGYAWSISSGSLPAGLTLSPATGAISGTPSGQGTWTFTAAVSDNSSPAQVQTAATSLTVYPTPLAIAPASLASGTVGSAYAGTLQASGGVPAYKWSVWSGSLPPGLSLSSTSGVISGTPTAGGTFNFSTAVSDHGSPAQTRVANMSLVIGGTSLAITSSTLSSATIGSPYSGILRASGGTSGYSWSVVKGSLPAGLTLSSNGVVTGTPAANGTFSFAVTVTDAGSPAQVQTASTSIVVSASTLAITTRGLASATSGTAYAAAMSASGGTPSYTWSVASGSLPTGLTFSPSGAITGTPSAGGSYSFTAAVRDSGSPAQTQSMAASINVSISASTLSIASPVFSPGSINTPFAGSLSASGGTPGYRWSIASGTLPAGLSLSPATGTISGTPTSNGRSVFTAAVTDNGSPAQTQTVLTSIVIAPTPLAIVSSTLSPGGMGQAYSDSLKANGGTPSYRWTIVKGSLPPGLVLSSTTGAITGSPTATGNFNFFTEVADGGSPAQLQTAAILITVTGTAALTLRTPALPSGTDGVFYASTLQATGGNPGYSWSIRSGSLPPGLTLAANTGVISGTPTAKGSFSFTATVGDQSTPAQTQSAAASITVANASQSASGQGSTWYVRPDGGTRYSSIVTSGQCDGTSDTPYTGAGTNQHCAFKDVRYLWQDGSYTITNDPSVFPAYGWIGSGGDTYLIRGSIATGVSYRIGWQNGSTAFDTASGQYWGLQGDQYNSEPPLPLSGSASQHTRILGENYLSCHAASAKTALFGGFGINAVLRLNGTSYVDVACLDITDHSRCGLSGQQVPCKDNNGTPSDYAKNGITWSNTSTNDTLTDVHIHGLADAGMKGPTGDGVVMSYIDVIGNASSGWNADDNSNTSGTGSLLVQNFNISWNGCAEEYPIVHALPYNDCTDDSNGGYGDGFGTATLISNPGWNAHFDQGVVAYNTQDGLDALHLSGVGSSMNISRVLAYGNMGQQIKIGGAQGVATNNQIYGNCRAMTQAIPGTPAGYNTHLSDFCRASDSTLLVTVNNNRSLQFVNNTVYSASHTAVEIECDPQGGGACDTRSVVDFRNNIFVGFLNNPADGYPDPSGRNDTYDYANPIYVGLAFNPLYDAGSIYTNNLTFHPKSNWDCPTRGGTAAICGDPNLADETWHLYGYSNMSPSANSPVLGAGTLIPGVTVDYSGQTRGMPPSVGSLEH